MLQVELNHILREEDALGRLTEIISAVEVSGSTYVLTKNGLPVVAIVSPDQLKGLEELSLPVATPVPAMPSQPVELMPQAGLGFTPSQYAESASEMEPSVPADQLIGSSSIVTNDLTSLLNEKLPEEETPLMPSMPPTFQAEGSPATAAPVAPVQTGPELVMGRAESSVPVEPMTPIEPLAPVQPVEPLAPVAAAPLTTPVLPTTPAMPSAPATPTTPTTPVNNLGNLPPLTGSLDLPETDLSNSSPMA